MHTAQLMPLPLTVSCFSKIQIGFTILVPAHLGCPGQRAVKRVLSITADDAACSNQPVCVQLPTFAVSVTLLAFAAERRAAVTLVSTNIYNAQLSRMSHCAQRAAAPLWALGGRCCQSIYPARTALSSKPTVVAVCSRMTGQTDRRTFDRFIDPLCIRYTAVSIAGCITQYTMSAHLPPPSDDAYRPKATYESLHNQSFTATINQYGDTTLH